MVNVITIDFAKSFVLSRFNTPKVIESLEAQKLQFRVAFYDVGLDRVTAPVTYSE